MNGRIVGQRVTLTFDNGPTPGVTGAVLDLLARHEVTATFFVIGEKLRDGAARRLAERAVADGHQLGNHTLTHTVPLGRMERGGDIDGAIREIDDAQALLGDLAPRRLFRPYGAGGVISDALIGPRGLAHLNANRYEAVTWNCVPRDWEDPDGWVETCAAQMALTQWPVVVVHDVPNAALTRLPAFLERFSATTVDYRRDFPDDCRLTAVPA